MRSLPPATRWSILECYTIIWDENFPHKMLRRISSIFEQFAPKALEPAWDNTGILVEPFKLNDSNKILLTIDLTSGVLEEAISRNISVVIAYHPVIFKGIKKIDLNDPKQRMVSSCIHHGIGVFCPHTRLDAIDNGINDWLIKPFNGETIVPEDRMGRVINLKVPLSGIKIIGIVKDHLELKHVQVANVLSTVKSVAVCAGSGASVFAKLEADCYITGELDHHTVLDFAERGRMVIVTNHTNTERGYLHVLKSILEQNKVSEVYISEVDKDPLSVV